MNLFKKSGPQQKDLLQEIDNLTKELNDLVKRKEELKLGSFSQFDRSMKGVSTSDFYDGVIDIPNLRSLREGWDIHVKDRTQYNDLAKREGVVVSIVGNYGKGKTFLLSLLSDQVTPHGFNVNTQGISIRYLRDKSDNNKIRPVIILDTKGGSLPLEVSGNNVENDRPLEESRVGNALEKKREEESRFKQILRDHDATEDVLQNFIMEEANIIIIVVSDLTFPDQRLITKITSKFKENESKKIIVVHNLFHAKAKKDVENKLKEFILRSFKLKLTEFAEFDVNKNQNYYVENGPKNTLIHHVILAKHDTEAGNFYNDVAIKHIKACIDANGNSKSIDVIESFHCYLQKSLQSYIETKPKLESTDIQLENDANQKSMRLKMAKKESFELKAVMIDELGLLRIFKESNQFQPKYCLYEEVISDTESYLCMKIECPDGLSKIEPKVRHNTDEFSIQITGSKPEDQKIMQGKLADTRDCGDFFVETEMYGKSKYRFDYDGIIETPIHSYLNGMAILKWKLRPVTDAWHIADAEDAQAAPPVRPSPVKLKGTVAI